MTDEEIRAEYLEKAKTLFKGKWFAFRDSAVSYDLYSFEELCGIYADLRMAGEETEYLTVNLSIGFETFKEAKAYLLGAFRADRSEINMCINALRGLTESKARRGSS